MTYGLFRTIERGLAMGVLLIISDACLGLSLLATARPHYIAEERRRVLWAGKNCDRMSAVQHKP
jgi:hypothetical protein